MDIQAEKIKLAKLLLETEDTKIIESIKRIFKKELAADFWDELSTDQKEEIEKASKEIKSGDTIEYESFMDKYR